MLLIAYTMMWNTYHVPHWHGWTREAFSELPLLRDENQAQSSKRWDATHFEQEVRVPNADASDDGS